jgi:hypothetical protein
LSLGERAVFGDGDNSSFAERERFGWSPFAFGRDHLPRPRGPAVTSFVMVAIVVVSGSLSSMRSRMAAPDFSFLCQRRSCSQRSFIMLGASWKIHGVGSCSVSNAWSCASDLVDGFGLGFAVRSLFALVQSCSERLSSPVMCEDLGWFLVVICFIPRIFLVKSCTVLPG